MTLKLVAVATLCFLSLSLTAGDPPHKDLEALKQMSGFEKLLPRGKIAAVFKPEFVSAQAAELPDDAWIIGVSRGGDAKAYSINLLNHHEVVNDFIGDKPIATTW